MRVCKSKLQPWIRPIPREASRRALILLPHDLPGGAERVTMTVAEAALKSERFSEVVIFVLSRGNSGTLSKIASNPKARVIFTNSKRQLGGLMALVRTCKQGQYDFVFSSFLDLNALASKLRKWGILKTNWLVSRESTMFFERDFGWKNSLIRLLYRSYGSQDLVVCQTDRMRKSLSKNTKERFSHLIKTLPNPIPFDVADEIVESTNEPLLDRKGRIAWCGRMSAVKSPLRAVESIAFLHRKGFTGSRLIMIGDGPMRPEVEELARALNLEDHIEFKGFVEKPIEVMRTCQVGLVTSDVEGFPNVVLEMLSAGIRGIVSTDCAGDLIDVPGVTLSREKTPESLAETLSTVLQRETAPSGVVEYLSSRRPNVFLSDILPPCE